MSETKPVDTKADKSKVARTLSNVDADLEHKQKLLSKETDRFERCRLKGELDELLDERLRLSVKAKV